MKLDSDDFELFGVPRRQSQDRAQLDERWRDLQAKVHPDRFASDGAAAQRLAMQWAVRVNEAYQRLKDPLRRAAYLCELQGASIDAENNTAMPAGFLMQQMEWREAVVEAKASKDEAKLDQLATDKQREEKLLFAKLAEQLGVSISMSDARETVRKLRFLEKLGEEIDIAAEEIES